MSEDDDCCEHNNNFWDCEICNNRKYIKKLEKENKQLKNILTCPKDCADGYKDEDGDWIDKEDMCSNCYKNEHYTNCYVKEKDDE